MKRNSKVPFLIISSPHAIKDGCRYEKVTINQRPTVTNRN